MSQRKPGIERDRLLCIFFGDGIELLAKQHARSKKIAGGRVGGHAEHASECLARLRIIFGLDVADAENVRRVDIGAWKPGLYFLQQGNCLRGMAPEIVRQAEKLLCLAIVRVGTRGFIEMFDGSGIVALLVVRRADLEIEPWYLRVRGCQRLKLSDGVVYFSLLHQRAGVREVRGGSGLWQRRVFRRWLGSTGLLCSRGCRTEPYHKQRPQR